MPLGYTQRNAYRNARNKIYGEGRRLSASQKLEAVVLDFEERSKTEEQRSSRVKSQRIGSAIETMANRQRNRSIARYNNLTKERRSAMKAVEKQASQRKAMLDVAVEVLREDED